MKKSHLGILAIVIAMMALFVSAAWALPVSKTLAWDAGAGADDYLVYLDGALLGTTAGLTMPFTISTAGSHTFSVISRNAWDTSAAATLTVNVVSPGKSGNLRIQ